MPALVDRRTLLRGAGALAVAAAGTGGLAGCGSSDGRTTVRFAANKRETITYFQRVTEGFNRSQSRVTAELENNDNTRVIADFVRSSPVAVGINGFDITFGGYMRRGVLADQRDNPVLDTIRPDMVEFVQAYGTYRNQIGAVPYSIAGQGVLYNRDLFARAGVRVPTTWSEFLQVCRRLQSRSITPLLGTFADDWTLGQGMFNYSVVGMLDVAKFFRDLEAVGDDLSPASPQSFSSNFREPLVQIKQLLPFFNSNARTIAYDQGNREFAAGRAAMMFQGPWAYAGVLGANPQFKGGMFPLPMTDDPADTTATINLDQVVWTPASATGAERAGGLAVMDYLMRPEIVHRYNADNLAFSPDKAAPEQSSPLVSGLNPYVLSGRYSQGPELYIPTAIPARRYLQEYIYGGDVETFLGKLDRDWKRLAIRLSA
ncbi:ABC transporter substrate-binding protein [Barrientosiimonas endolithica]|uniref:Carbohydrate-binding protein n=1 Tax=Barrientosiimonas endolithica TaxID=1535208 RepID=A0ABM8HCY4_9MICO|nr:extracellular solute-binding protein [Barrientosiimonas endolithica]BDZ58811.1 carbohydrate-binding protein [Barrientosiimonas endolithica]